MLEPEKIISGETVEWVMSELQTIRRQYPGSNMQLIIGLSGMCELTFYRGPKLMDMVDLDNNRTFILFDAGDEKNAMQAFKRHIAEKFGS